MCLWMSGISRCYIVILSTWQQLRTAIRVPRMQLRWEFLHFDLRCSDTKHFCHLSLLNGVVIDNTHTVRIRPSIWTERWTAVLSNRLQFKSGLRTWPLNMFVRVDISENLFEDCHIRDLFYWLTDCDWLTDRPTDWKQNKNKLDLSHTVSWY